MYTRQQGNSQLVSTENPEDIVRKPEGTAWLLQYDRQIQGTTNKETTQTVRDENDPQGTFPAVHTLDLTNTVLSEAIKDGMQVGNSGTEYIIPTPLLKDIVGIENDSRCHYLKENWKHVPPLPWTSSPSVNQHPSTYNY